MANRWVLTGAGMVTPAGDGADELFSALLDGRPLTEASRSVMAEHGEFGALHAIRVPEFDPRRYLKRKGLKNLSRTSQLACAAASRLSDVLDSLTPGDVGVVFGSAWASLDTIVRFEREAYTEGARFVDPILFTETVANVPAGQVSIVFGWSALNATVAAGTGSGLEAIRMAREFLEEGRARVVVAGGGDEMNFHLVRTLQSEGRLASSTGAAPLSEGQTGPVGSEGVCLFTLESHEGAARRGAPVLGELRSAAGRFLGTGPSDGTRMVCALIERVLDQAGMAREEIDLVVMSANGTIARDRLEGAAIQEVFRGYAPPVMLPKAVLGETWAAAGPLGIVLALEAMRRSTVPPRPARVLPAEEFRGLILPVEPLVKRMRNALVLDCSESGSISAVVVSLPEDDDGV